jgi:hypothetical protein
MGVAARLTALDDPLAYAGTGSLDRGLREGPS